MELIKILVTGASHAGKTEFIRTLSEIEVVSTETPHYDDGFSIALDFGRVTVEGTPDDPQAALYLFGTPGARRFEPALFAPMMSPRERTGLVVVVDPSQPQAFDEVRRVLGEVRRADRPYVIAVNRWDNTNAVPTDAVREELRIEAGEVLHRCNVRDREKAAAVIGAVLAQMPPDALIEKVRDRIGA